MTRLFGHWLRQINTVVVRTISIRGFDQVTKRIGQSVGADATLMDILVSFVYNHMSHAKLNRDFISTENTEKDMFPE